MPKAERLILLAVLACLTLPFSALAQSNKPAAKQPIGQDITVSVPLPEMPPPPFTESAEGLTIRIALPEPPPPVVILPADEVKETANAVAEEPKFVAVLPPEAPGDVVILSAEEPASEIRIAVPLPELPPEDPNLAAPQFATGSLPSSPAAPGAALAPETLASAVIPAPAPKAADEPVAGPIPAESLRAALQRLKAGTRVTDAEADEILDFYANQGFGPLWVQGGQWNDAAKSLRARLARADEEGLDPARYRTVAAFHSGGEPYWPALAAAEVQMTEALILYAREASTGRVRPQQVHALITPRLQKASAAAVLASLAGSSDPGAALQAYNPPHPEYAALRQHLARAKANRPGPMAGDPIPEGPALRPGMRDPRVPLIRARLGLEYATETVYDRSVSVRVASLQREVGLPANGVFTPQTRLAMLGEGPSAEEAEILANMEFWRWMPRDLGKTHILVNAPAYELTMRRDGAVIHEARVIVGKEKTQTPFFSDQMDHIVVNPSWYVPPGILKREPQYLDPAWAAAHGYEIRTRRGYTSVRMPPGASNALGYVKFMFPNEHAVYLHDTPKRTLFNARNRSLSNGCVRVENPFQLAAILMAQNGWSEAGLRGLIGRGERQMKLPEKMPIHLAYFTLTSDSSGNLERHPDIYGHSQRVKQLIGLP
ncbi:MAG: L,D-transpeptidase family protein [Methylocystis sp.]|nr:L,D-transpeptidase family protein [Methylocystis sp.]MCA3583336.1 L,D-transpeptidase family protein [Methylocystis sp.]MCA3588823.1 L,D-transpeptidase family protein [Methylocystis sp.]MCA3591855.1 L,D-transpeptidase family protein [Methylocystis sp.]